MIDQPLSGKTVAVLVANGFEETDMTEPQRALLGAGATIKLVSPEQGLVNGWHETVWGHYFPLDVALSAALAADFDAILVPGGDRSIDKLKGNPHATRFVRGFVDGEKPVVAVGRGVDLLVAADRASGRRVAAFAGQDDALREAGAIPVDEPVVIDGPLITARDDVDVGVLKGEIVRQFVELAGAMAAAA